AVLVGLSCCIAPKAPPPPASAFVRVNQVGYPAAATKRAYLMSTANQAGAAFSVKNGSGTVVYSGTVGVSLGTWSSTYKFVQPLDFDTLSTAGTYTISVASATSPPFKIDTGQNVYATAIANGLFFYQTERDGPNYKYIRNRPVLAAGAAGSPISPNLAGRDAAAFATCFVLYKKSDPTFAAQCLTAAEHIFDLANTSPGQLTTYAPFDFYPETE